MAYEGAASCGLWDIDLGVVNTKPAKKGIKTVGWKSVSCCDDRFSRCRGVKGYC